MRVISSCTAKFLDYIIEFCSFVVGENLTGESLLEEIDYVAAELARIRETLVDDLQK